MARVPTRRHRWQSRVPHACGDGPPSADFRQLAAQSSPRLWGWPATDHQRNARLVEFPTPVGMARSSSSGVGFRAGVPHACGDGPNALKLKELAAVSSPRLWGWPEKSPLLLSFFPEFPTPVGMARPRSPRGTPRPGVPHACGDGPPNVASHVWALRSSPRLWGWPGPRGPHRNPLGEFPTPVGMARRRTRPPYTDSRVPHACGDGPPRPTLNFTSCRSSPRLWGWPGLDDRLVHVVAEFPTPVGMARRRVRWGGCG